MTVHKYAIVVGLLAALVGLICLFTTAEVTLASGRTIACGSIPSPNNSDARVANLTDALTGGRGQLGGAAACDEELSGRMGWVFPLLIGGVVIALGAWLTSPRRSDKQPTNDQPAGDASPA